LFILQKESRQQQRQRATGDKYIQMEQRESRGLLINYSFASRLQFIKLKK